MQEGQQPQGLSPLQCLPGAIVCIQEHQPSKLTGHAHREGTNNADNATAPSTLCSWSPGEGELSTAGMLSSHSLPTATPPWSTVGTQPEQRGAARQALSKSLLSTPQVLGPRGAAFQCFTSGRCSHGAQKQSLSADTGEQGTMLRCPGPLSCYPRLTLVALSYTCLPDGTRKP